ncbi:hypothetical protein [Methylorubrum populi]
MGDRADLRILTPVTPAGLEDLATAHVAVTADEDLTVPFVAQERSIRRVGFKDPRTRAHSARSPTRKSRGRRAPVDPNAAGQRRRGGSDLAGEGDVPAVCVERNGGVLERAHPLRRKKARHDKNRQT